MVGAGGVGEDGDHPAPVPETPLPHPTHLDILPPVHWLPYARHPNLTAEGRRGRNDHEDPRTGTTPAGLEVSVVPPRTCY